MQLSSRQKKYGWVVIFSSGYNNADGIGYFFFVNPKNGQLLETVSTGVGSYSNQAGLAFSTAFLPSYADGTADALYAGDLLGNLWRVDLTKTTGAYLAPTKIAVLKDSSGVAQPVTSRPLIQSLPDTQKRYVSIGTGRLLSAQDSTSSQIQTFYTIADGTLDAFYKTTTLPAGVTFPISRTNLVADSNLLTGIGSAPSQTMGLYVDLGASPSGVASRVLSMPQGIGSFVTFISTLPNGDVCNPSGTSQVYAFNIGTGTSILTNSLGNLVSFTSFPNVVVSLQFFNVSGKVRLIAGTNGTPPSTSNAPTNINSNTIPKRLNWRELPTAD